MGTHQVKYYILLTTVFVFTPTYVYPADCIRIILNSMVVADLTGHSKRMETYEGDRGTL